MNSPWLTSLFVIQHLGKFSYNFIFLRISGIRYGGAVQASGKRFK